jgi:tetratricopeptide (TPR) repeat protein
MPHSSAKVALVLFIAAVTVPMNTQAAHGQTPRERQLEARDHVNQGNFLMGQHHFAEAIDEYKKALEIDPMNSVAKDNIVTCHINWGNFFVSQRKYDEALKEYQTCLILNPYNPKALNNIRVVKATMARDAAAQAAKAKQEGDDNIFEDTKPAAVGAGKAAKKEQAQPPSAVILTPGMKVGSGDKPQGDMATPTPSASYGDGDQPVAAPAAPPAQAEAPAAKIQNQPAAASTGPSVGSLEDMLAAVELKIYGRKQNELPFIKRLEKIETDTSGQTRSGTIKERIDFLRKNYGL